jgi:hypothetical protein
MSTPPRDPNVSRPEPHDEEDTYGLSQPVELPSEDLRPEPFMAREPVITFEEPPPPPKLPLVTGVFSFLFYLQTFAVWAVGSIGLAIGLLLCLYCVYLVEIGLTVAARCLAFPSLWLTAFPLGYLSVCCLSVLEQTSHGYDKITDWSVGEWREWLWSLGYTLGALAPALLVGAAVGTLFSFTGSWVPLWLITFLSYPILLLSALDNGSILAPLSMPMLRSLRQLWWGWLIFYGETGIMLVGLLLLLFVLFPVNPFMAVAVTTPPTVAFMLLYARLLGRLVWCIGQVQGDKAS